MYISEHKYITTYTHQ